MPDCCPARPCCMSDPLPLPGTLLMRVLAGGAAEPRGECVGASSGDGAAARVAAPLAAAAGA